MKSTADLRRRILSRRARVAVVGQGYVGVSLAAAAADAGFPVVGVDVDEARIADLAAGTLSVPGVNEAAYTSATDTGRMVFTTDPEGIRESDVDVICVPTPLRDGTPDLSHVEEACREVAARLAPGRLVILESTTYPGTTEEVVQPILERSGLRAGRDFLLAYSPERIDPGNLEYGLRNTPRIVGGVSGESTGMAALFYGQIVEKVVSVSSPRTAELAKLLENTFRHVNIGLVNELAMVCRDMGIDVWEVIDATSSKPFGFMPFFPGPGVGGNCIPVDPAYLRWHVRRDAGRHIRILEQAEDVNTQMPAYTAARLSDVLNEVGKPVKGSSVLVLGVTYKADVGDPGHSPPVKVMAALDQRGARVGFHDPFVDSLEVNGRTVRRTEITNGSVRRADCVALLTAHRSYDLDWIAEHAALVFDARNAYGQDRRPNVVRL